MTKLLVQGEVILAQGEFILTEDEIRSSDAIYPKHVIPGWAIATCPLPADFTVTGYTYDWPTGAVVKKPPVVVVPTVAEYTTAVQKHLDAKAQSKNYDDIVSACSYAGAPNPFQAEGTAFVGWRGDVWAKCYEVMGLVQAGQRTPPTIEELIAELPVLVL